MMTETPVGVSPPQSALMNSVSPAGQELAGVRELVKAARSRRAALTGPDGLLRR